MPPTRCSSRSRSRRGGRSSCWSRRAEPSAARPSARAAAASTFLPLTSEPLRQAAQAALAAADIDRAAAGAVDAARAAGGGQRASRIAAGGAAGSRLHERVEAHSHAACPRSIGRRLTRWPTPSASAPRSSATRRSSSFCSTGWRGWRASVPRAEGEPQRGRAGDAADPGWPAARMGGPVGGGAARQGRGRRAEPRPQGAHSCGRLSRLEAAARG